MTTTATPVKEAVDKHEVISLKATLIVCPAVLLDQWETDVQKFFEDDALVYCVQLSSTIAVESSEARMTRRSPRAYRTVTSCSSATSVRALQQAKLVHVTCAQQTGSGWHLKLKEMEQTNATSVEVLCARCHDHFLVYCVQLSSTIAVFPLHVHASSHTGRLPTFAGCTK